MSFSFFNTLNEIAKDSIWVIKRPNISSVVLEGNCALVGDCALDIGAVVKGKFMEKDESVSSVESVKYEVLSRCLS